MLMFLAFNPSPEKPARVDFYLTTPDKRRLLERQPDPPLNAEAPPGALTIDIDPGKSYQRMEGFGAALTESSAWLIRKQLSTSQRNRLMRKLEDSGFIDKLYATYGASSK